ncbi:glycoside hydrolase superfamily [Melampsora americana]|nr:glycoside hydrolase superfamily [Melampsora americana]
MSNSTCSLNQPSSITLNQPNEVRNFLSLPTFGSDPDSSTFVKRDSHRLLFPDGRPFKIVGPNIYWLAIDENVGSTASFPSSQRVLDAFATAATMGATTVRSTTLGVSLGTKNAIEPQLGNFNSQALDQLGFVVYVARLYAIKLIIPLTDQYDYYHGGYRTFLRWRGISDTNSSAFYDTSSIVYQDFITYITTILNFTNPYTQMKISEDPTILAWETGNELDRPDPKWTRSVAETIKTLAPNQLVGSGRYGVNRDDLGIESIDLVVTFDDEYQYEETLSARTNQVEVSNPQNLYQSYLSTDHFYPPSSDRYFSGLTLATDHSKVYFAGEFDWTGRSHNWISLLSIIIPGLIFLGLALSLYMMKTSRFPYRPPLRYKRKPFLVEKWHLALLLAVISIFVLGGIGYSVGVGWNGLESLLSTMENSGGNGGLYWSLFGRDDGCCGFVNHNDGFTLHYPGQGDAERQRISRLVTHAARIGGRIKFQKTESVPWVNVVCPQIGWTNSSLSM